jgi:RHS repeat-associated protein
VGQLGYFYDATLLQYYIRARHYRPALARWLSVDPLGFLGTGGLDAAAELAYYRARYYHAQLGRFMARDPIAADISLYRYCGDSPLVYVDPTGEACQYISGHWGKYDSTPISISWGRMSGSASVSLTDIVVGGLICDYCCGLDASGNAIWGKKGNISIGAHGTYSLSLQRNFIDYQQTIGLPAIGNVAVSVRAWASATANGSADFSASTTGTWCPPNAYSGTITVCGISSTSLVARFGGQASLVVSQSGLRAGVEGVGTATLLMRLCATMNVNTGQVNSISFSPWIRGAAVSALAYVDEWDAQQKTWVRHWGSGVSF